MSVIRFFADGIPPVPPSGYVTVFVDPADEHLKQIDSNGTIIDLTGALGSAFIAQNNTAGTLLKGRAVHYASWDDVNNLPEIVYADSSVSTDMPSIGVLESDVISGNAGIVTFQGTVSGVDTSGLIEGQTLWVGNTGQLVASRPTGATDLIQQIADVGQIGVADGTIFVHGALRVNALPNLTDGKMWQGDVNNQPVEIDAPVVPGDVLYTSITNGGEITANIDPTKFDVAAGSGRIVDFTDPLNPVTTNVAWSAFIGESVPDIVNDTFTMMYINAAGALIKVGQGFLTNEDYRSFVVLGTVIHSFTEIASIISSPIPAYNTVHSILDYIRKAGGIVTGSDVFLSNADLTFVQGAGVYNDPFVNYGNNILNPTEISNPEEDPKPFNYSMQDGVGGFSPFPASTLINPDDWDDGTGTLNTVAPNKWTFQPAYFFGQINRLAVIYGQKEYDTIEDTIDAISIDFSEMLIDPGIQQGSNLVGFFVIKQGATDLSDGNDAQFFSVGEALGGGGVSPVTTYDGLTDTPTDKTGAALNRVRVNAGETAHEYIDDTILNLNDVLIGSYSGKEFQTVQINAAGTGIDSIPNQFITSSGHADPAITGVLTGALVSQFSATQITVAAGTGRIVNFYDDYQIPTITNVSWATQQITIPNIGVDTQTFIYADNAGVIQTQNTAFTPADKRTKIVLGFTLNTIAPAEITLAFPVVNAIGATAHGFTDMFDFAGVASRGARVDQTSDTGANGALAMSVDQHDLFAPSLNWHNSKTSPNRVTIAASDPVVFSYLLQTGAIDATAQTLIDPLNYDNAGVKTTTPTAAGGARTTIQYLYQLIGGDYVVLYGQSVYQNISEALDLLGDDAEGLVLPGYVSEYGTPLAAVVVAQGCIDLADTSTAKIIQAESRSLSGGGGGGATTFIGLSDTPSAYAGEAGKIVAVNGAEDGLEFIDASAGSIPVTSDTLSISQANSINAFSPGQIVCVVINIAVTSSTVGCAIGATFNNVTGNFVTGLYKEDAGTLGQYDKVADAVTVFTAGATSEGFHEITWASLGAVTPGIYYAAFLNPNSGGTNMNLFSNNDPNGNADIMFVATQVGQNTLPAVINQGAAHANRVWMGLR